jgi:hypothetical protein
MIRSPATPLAVAKWITIASAVATLGCATKALIYPEPEWNTLLPPGVSSNPKQFLADIAAVPKGDSVHERARSGNCLFCTVNVRIQTLGETWRIKPDTGPATGLPIARIDNLDRRHQEARFGFRPSTEAVYFFWVDRNPRSMRARLTVLQVPISGGVVTAGHQKDLHLCHHRPANQKPTSDVDFYEYRYDGPCTEVATTLSPGMTEASLLPSTTVAALFARVAAILGRGMIFAGGGWIDCNSGCCT